MDSDGYSCQWFNENGGCDTWGDCCEKDGHVANTACCKCGGGCSNILSSELKLYVNGFLCSANGRYRFGLDQNSDLCLLDGSQKIWSAGTCCETEIIYAKMQNDGNLVVRTSVSKKVLWASHTAGSHGATCLLGNDGKVEIIDAAGSTVKTIASTSDSLQVDDTTSNVAKSITGYIPGDLSTVENGLLLSTGLKSRIIATSGEYVEYTTGAKSSIQFHWRPDGGAVFSDPDNNGWVYVSNSEVANSNGGSVPSTLIAAVVLSIIK